MKTPLSICLFYFCKLKIDVVKPKTQITVVYLGRDSGGGTPFVEKIINFVPYLDKNELIIA